VESFLLATIRPFLKYAMGWPFYDSTTPIPMSQAFVSSTNSLKKSRKANTGVIVVATFSFSKAFWVVESQENFS
jgi:hypothetical protein